MKMMMATRCVSAGVRVRAYVNGCACVQVSCVVCVSCVVIIHLVDDASCVAACVRRPGHAAWKRMMLCPSLRSLPQVDGELIQ